MVEFNTRTIITRDTLPYRIDKHELSPAGLDGFADSQH